MTTEDLDDMASLLGSPKVMSFYPAPKTRSEAAGWIAWNQETYVRDGFGLWVITEPCPRAAAASVVNTTAPKTP